MLLRVGWEHSWMVIDLGCWTAMQDFLQLGTVQKENLSTLHASVQKTESLKSNHGVSANKKHECLNGTDCAWSWWLWTSKLEWWTAADARDWTPTNYLCFFVLKLGCFTHSHSWWSRLVCLQTCHWIFRAKSMLPLSRCSRISWHGCGPMLSSSAQPMANAKNMLSMLIKWCGTANFVAQLHMLPMDVCIDMHEFICCWWTCWVYI